MATFGVIAEGPCDQIVIENVLTGYFGNQEDPVINFIQPPIPASRTDRSPPGGWTRVFESLRRGDPQQAMQFNEYIVIHIDTDMQEEAGFDVPRREGGSELPFADRVGRVIAKLTSCIDPPCYQTYSHRILFAVAVESIECWLLPLLFNNNKAEKITGCLETANRELRKRDKDGLSSSDDNKFPKAYDAASRGYLKRKTLMEHHGRNPSLKVFIEQLDALQARLSKPNLPEAEMPSGSVGEIENPPGNTATDQPG